MSASINPAGSTTASTTGSTVPGSTGGAIGALSNNYNDFLTLLTTQLKNQDPSNPTDPSQFTSELAQFAGVQQQISTNTNLSTLIQLAQSQQVLQGSSLLGKHVTLNSTTLPLQNGTAHLDFTAAAAQPVLVTITDSGGNAVFSQTVSAAQGANGWDWNGRNAAGVPQPDGGYTASVTTNTDSAAAGTGTALSFTTRGTVTAVNNTGTGIDLALGPATVSIGTLSNVSS